MTVSHASYQIVSLSEESSSEEDEGESRENMRAILGFGGADENWAITGHVEGVHSMVFVPPRRGGRLDAGIWAGKSLLVRNTSYA